MSEDRIEGAARQGVGRLQDAAGSLLGGKTELRGKVNEAAGAAQNAYGQFKDQAADVMDQARGQFGDLYEQLEDFVQEQPLIALAIGAGAGLVLGLLMRGGRKVVYVRK